VGDDDDDNGDADDASTAMAKRSIERMFGLPSGYSAGERCVAEWSRNRDEMNKTQILSAWTGQALIFFLIAGRDKDPQHRLGIYRRA
jgi:hypothetical protein